ncbi:hypothetical protein BDR26DRAFT_904468 [Obelidium mucronatum]|nr:hypothetical protein BDR26DRAFT_904468 [Obelidium mucronatum]
MSTDNWTTTSAASKNSDTRVRTRGHTAKQSFAEDQQELSSKKTKGRRPTAKPKTPASKTAARSSNILDSKVKELSNKRDIAREATELGETVEGTARKQAPISSRLGLSLGNSPAFNRRVSFGPDGFLGSAASPTGNPFFSQEGPSDTPKSAIADRIGYRNPMNQSTLRQQILDGASWVTPALDKDMAADPDVFVAYVRQLLPESNADPTPVSLAVKSAPSERDLIEFRAKIELNIKLWKSVNHSAAILDAEYGRSQIPDLVPLTSTFNNSLQLYLVSRQEFGLLEAFDRSSYYSDPFLGKPFNTFPGAKDLATQFFQKTNRYNISTVTQFNAAMDHLRRCIDVVFVYNGSPFRSVEFSEYHNLLKTFLNVHPDLLKQVYQVHRRWTSTCMGNSSGLYMRFSSRHDELARIFIEETRFNPFVSLNPLNDSSFWSKFDPPASPARAIPAARPSENPALVDAGKAGKKRKVAIPADEVDIAEKPAKKRVTLTLGDCQKLKIGNQTLCFRFQFGDCNIKKCSFLHLCQVCASESPCKLENHSAYDGHPNIRVAGVAETNQKF